ncbi:hypothetical protein PanWU01x14_279770 [Parasponia andersonii]|uniref:Uncharacterized protein n=1 Tax=Parasponia andersonii TaxID=3476 RepID=A0A2P5B1U2_PARAD|nr:hypothetical protein PanWU01x14_279770 [Parasponia andersonii]
MGPNSRYPLTHDFFSETSKILHPSSSTTIGGGRGSRYLDLLGWRSSFIRSSSFDDLLLVDRTRQDFFICNSLTGQFVALLKSPLFPEAWDEVSMRPYFHLKRSSFRCAWHWRPVECNRVIYWPSGPDEFSGN